MSDKQARLDADKRAKPLTRLIGHVIPGQHIGPGSVQPDAIEHIETGDRTPLVNQTPTEAWLAKPGALRSLVGQCGTYHGRYECRVEFREAGRLVAGGRGATIEEACARACNALMAGL
jgi:hypothetical protein